MRARHPSAPTKKSRHRVIRAVLESLEPRRLLAAQSLTLHGGDVFEFSDAAGNIERIRLQGNITAQIIGSHVDGANNLTLVNLPGNLNGVPVNGGIALVPDGVQIIAPIRIVNPLNPAENDNAPAIQALASDAAGNLYAIDFKSIPAPKGSPVGTPPSTIVQVAQVDPVTGIGTVVADIGAEVAAAGAPNFAGAAAAPTGVTAAAFDGNGNLFFVVTGGTGNTPVLMSVNPAAGSSAAVAGTLGVVPGTFSGAKTVTAITFNGGNVVAAGTAPLGANGGVVPSIFTVSAGNTDSTLLQAPIRTVGAAINGPVSGIAFVPGNPNPLITAGSGAAAQVYNVATGSGDAIAFGPIVGNPPARDKTGQSVGDITFDPGLVDPFTGQQGALVGTDTATHELFFLSQVNRIQNNNIYSIYVAQSDANASIAVALVPPLNVANRPMEPFTGSIGSIRVINAQTGNLNVVAAPAGTGSALLGSLSRHINPNSNNDDLIPFLSATVPSDVNFGVLPFSFLGTTLAPGLIVGPGQNLGKFLFGGTVTGQVNVHGSIDQFYSGWLLTGNADGETLGGPSIVHNFNVDGDIRQLIVDAAIGTDSDKALNKPTFVTGFDMRVGGTLGVVHTFDSLIGNVNVDHNPLAPSLANDQSETEFRGAANYDPWDFGMLGDSPIFNNDTFDTAQFISQSSNSTYGLSSAVVVNGVLQDDTAANDHVDYYAVPLLAGQSIVVSGISSSGFGGITTGVFDPDGRLIASDNSFESSAAVQGKQFTLTTTMPGVYRFAVAIAGDTHFTGASANVGDIPYQLVIQNVGDVALGAIEATNNILDDSVFSVIGSTTSSSPGFGAVRGDIGTLYASGTVLSENSNQRSIVAENGNLRAVQGNAIGLGVGGDPEITVPNGSVGLVRTTGGNLFFNHGFAPVTPGNPSTVAGTTGFTPTSAIGGNYQLVSSAGNFAAYLVANGNIGTIRAKSMSDVRNSVFSVDANKQSNAGTIDLIDDAGDLGTLGTGGPEIVTGPHGNVRYMHVLGTVYRDIFFGGGSPEQSVFQAGQTASIIDDSGSVVNLAPAPNSTSTTAVFAKGVNIPTPVPPVGAVVTGSGGNTTFVVTNPDGSTTTTIITLGAADNKGNRTQTTTVQTSAQLTVTAYGIEGSGGSAIINVTSTGGLTVNGSGNLSGQSAEIGTINVTGPGSAPVEGVTPITPVTGKATGSNVVPLPPAPTIPVAGQQLAVNLGGPVRLDAFEITGGNITTIINSTGGEIVNATATSIGNLSSSGSIGAALQHSTPADIMPLATPLTAFPFNQQHNGIVSTGSIVSISAPNIGNIQSGNNIGTVSGTIRGPVVATGTITGVNFGRGIYPSGTGDLSSAGIYAGGVIGNVGNSTPADIRGNIVSKSAIVSVHVSNGSIINSEIGDLADFAFSSNLVNSGIVIPDPSTTFTNPVINLGSISTTGSGGMIGDAFFASHYGTIANHGGFGIFNSSIGTEGDGTINTISADGYGLRGDAFFGGSSVGSIIATGSGALQSTGTVEDQVRYGEVGGFDPFFGFAPNILTDVNVYLTSESPTTPVTATTPVVPGLTDTGVIQDSFFVGNRSLGTLRAYQIRATNPATNADVINFANNIGSITTTSLINGLTLTTGRLNKFAPGGDLMHTSLTIAGKIGSLILKSNFTDTSSIIATGPNGNIGSIKVIGNMDGIIRADGGKIGSITINGNFFGQIFSRSLSNLTLHGSLGNGSLNIAGSVGTLNVFGNLGQAGNTLTVQGSLNQLNVRGYLLSNVIVYGNLKNLTVGGSIVAPAKITVGNVLSLLKVGGDFQAGATIQAHALKSKKIKGIDGGSIVIV